MSLIIRVILLCAPRQTEALCCSLLVCTGAPRVFPRGRSPASPAPTFAQRGVRRQRLKPFEHSLLAAVHRASEAPLGGVLGGQSGEGAETAAGAARHGEFVCADDGANAGALWASSSSEPGTFWIMRMQMLEQ